MRCTKHGGAGTPSKERKRMDKTSWTWDTNQMRRGLSRKLFACIQEMAGEEVLLTEQVATELARLVNPRAPKEGLKRLYEGHEDPRSIEHLLVYKEDPRAGIRHMIWWAEEMARAEGIYRVGILDSRQEARYEGLMESFRISGTRRGLQPEEVARDADSIILCQAAAMGSTVLVTANHHSIDIAYANRWAAEREKQGEMEQDKVAMLAETLLGEWCEKDGDKVFLGMVAAAWPDSEEATATHVQPKMDQMLRVMEGTRELAGAAVYSRHRFEDHPRPEEVVEEVRKVLPRKTRSADRRHPTHPGNTGRNWSTPADSVRDVVEIPRWRLSIEDGTFVMKEHRMGQTYQEVERIPAGQTRQIAQALMKRGIEVHGLPRHGGKDEGGGFTAALGRAISEELTKERGIGR